MHKVLRDLKGLLVVLEKQALLVLRVIKELQEPKVQREHKVVREPQVRKAQQER